MSLIKQFEASALVRAAYCSEALFSHWAHRRGNEVEVARLLHPSPRNVHLDRIGGIFHAGNRFYLQVVEGPVESVHWYVEHGRQDERHQNFKFLTAHIIEQPAFMPGQMRFVGTEEQLYEIQQMQGERAFNPYVYDVEMISAFVSLSLDTES